MLAFLDNLTIPFDNDQAERDLRMLKAQQKVTDGFQAPSRRQAKRMRATLASAGYLSTLRKQGVALLAALEHPLRRPVSLPRLRLNRYN